MTKRFNQTLMTSFWKWFRIILLSAVFVAGICFQAQSARAADITSEITGISGADATYNGKKLDPNEVKNWNTSDPHQLTYNYTIQNGVSVKSGDTAKLTLPANTKFHDNQTIEIFANGSKTVIGTIKAKAGNTYGTIVFGNYYETHKDDRSGTINFPVSGTNPNGGGGSGNSTIAKNGYAWDGSWPGSNGDYSTDKNGRYRYVEWDSKINEVKHALVNPLITDTFRDTGKQKLLPNTLLVQYDDDKTNVPTGDYTINFSPTENPTGFTIQWKGTLTRTVNILYLAKVTDQDYLTTGAGITLHNQIKITGKDSTAGGQISDDTGIATGSLALGGNANGGGSSYSISVSKKWAGVPTALQGKTPTVQAELYANGKPTGEYVTLDKSHNYSATFSNLSKYDSNNKLISYTVGEKAVPSGYQGTIKPQTLDKNNHATLTNTYVQKKTNLAIKKQWEDIPKGTTAPAVTADLYQNGSKTDKTVTLDKSDNYTATIKGLPTTDKDGKTITYTIEEPANQFKDSTHYKQVTTGQQTPKDGVVTLTNKYVPTPTPKTTSVTVKKQWLNVPSNVKTPTITARLYADGVATNKAVTLTSGNHYTAIFKDLQKTNAKGKTITYTVAETSVPDGYTSTTTGQQPVKDGVVTLTNKYMPTPTPQTTNVKVKKQWVNVPSGVTTPSITVRLYANGVATDKTLTLDSANNYTGTFSNLPKNDANGNTITYTVAETSVPDGYTSTTTGQQPVKNGLVTLINTYHPDMPINPVNPVTPVNPNTPVTPDNPVTPVTPKTPSTPTKPTKPNKSHTIGTPDKPESEINKKHPKSTQTIKKQRRAVNHVFSNPQTNASNGDVPTSGKLPQTNDNQQQSLVASIIGALLLGSLGIGDVIKRLHSAE